jgi:predicted RNA binding protein YcfA (HicA-like mRNA interferase family)
MSPRLPRITAVALVRALHRAGWKDRGQQGSHLQLVHPEKPGARVTVPMHSGTVLALGTLKVVLDQAGLTPEELQELL